MADAGDGQALLGRGGGQQGSRAAEENPAELFLPDFRQIVAAQGDGAAAAAGASGVDVLAQVVKDQAAAVLQPPANGQALLSGQLQEQLLAVLPQVPGDDAVVVFRLPAQVLQVLPDGGQCRRG